MTAAPVVEWVTTEWEGPDPLPGQLVELAPWGWLQIVGVAHGAGLGHVRLWAEPIPEHTGELHRGAQPG